MNSDAPRADQVGLMDQPRLQPIEAASGKDAATLTAQATEDIAYWTQIDAIADVAGGIGAALAAAFAFLAFIYTRRQARAAERQVDLAENRVAEDRRTSLAQLRAQAMQVRGHIEIVSANVNIDRNDGQAWINLKFRNTGQSPATTIRVGCSMGVQIPDSGGWFGDPPSWPDLAKFNFTLSAGSDHQVAFDELLIGNNIPEDTWVLANAHVRIDWQDSLDWNISEEMILAGSVIPGKACPLELASRKIISDSLEGT